MKAEARKIAAFFVVIAFSLQPILVSLRLFNPGTDNLQQQPGESSSNGGTRTTATFLGLELTFVEPQAMTPSVVHCVGENFLPKLATGYRSCQYRNLCWDFQKRDFVLMQSQQQRETENLLQFMESQYIRTSFQFNTTVSTTGTNEVSLRQGMDLGWFPRTVSLESQFEGYYHLPSDVVVVPVQFPRNDAPPREVLFDFFLPIYNLQSMFGLQGKRLLLANLGPSCPSENESSCYSQGAMQFLPLMNQDATLKERFMTLNASIESHGERKKDYTFVQNSGRGALFYEFRRHLLQNEDLQLAETKLNDNPPFRITVAISQSKKSGVQDFHQQSLAIRERFAHQQLTIQTYNMSELPLRKQIEVVAETNIYISVMGDGAVPAFFLPRGATLVLFYNDRDEFVSVSKREATFPVKLDWDLWNNLSYLRVHWLPLTTKDTMNDLTVLTGIIQTEIQSLQEKEEEDPAPGADGVFNGMNVRYVDGSPKTRVHCVGDNFQERAHVPRSCEYQYMCLDLTSDRRNFSLYRVGGEEQHPARTSTEMAVSIGQTIRFSKDSAWFPLENTTTIEGFYELANNVVWIPFHAEQPNIHNPGHLLWDYFLPFFNLLVMFGLEGFKVLLSNVDDQCAEGGSSPCWAIITKFLPLVGVDSMSFRSTTNSELETSSPRRSSIVCAKHALAGIGMLTDHGWNRHGQRIEDYRDAHNVGRGPLFFAFRNYVSRNMGIDHERPLERPYKVVFSTHSSKNPARRLGFEVQIQALNSSFSSDEIVVEHHSLAKLALERQVKLATETAVFITVVGGSASTATFLPRGSTVILFFNDLNEFADHAPKKDFPSMIDWDFWNNASYLRVHWLPIRTMNTEIDLKVLTEIIRSDLLTLKSVQ